MTSTVVVRGSAGAIYTMDVPAAGHLREIFDGKLLDGSLSIIEGELSTGDTPTVAPDDPPPAPRRGRPPRVQPLAVEVDQVEE
jgi:hypothetical protein